MAHLNKTNTWLIFMDGGGKEINLLKLLKKVEKTDATRSSSDLKQTCRCAFKSFWARNRFWLKLNQFFCQNPRIDLYSPLQAENRLQSNSVTIGCCGTVVPQRLHMSTSPSHSAKELHFAPAVRLTTGLGVFRTAFL